MRRDRQGPQPNRQRPSALARVLTLPVSLVVAVGLGAGELAPARVATLASPTVARAQTADRPDAPDGAALYRAYCASCHGLSGRGDGPVASALRVPPANLTRLTQQHGGTFPADRVAQRIDGRQQIAAHGPSDMPVWGDALSSPTLADRDEDVLRARVQALVHFLATLQERRAP